MFNKNELAKLKLISNLVQDSKFIKALEISEALLKKSQNNHILLNMNGFILLKLNRLDQAYDYFLKSIQVDSNFYEAKLNLGRLYFFQKNYTKAIELLSQAIRLNKEDISAFSLLAKSFYKCEAFEEAIGTIRSFSHIKSLNKEILEILASSLYEADQLDESEKVYLQLLDADPGNKKYLVSMGRIYLNLNRIKEAKHFFLEALKYDENNYDLLYILYFFTDYELDDNKIDHFKNVKLNMSNYSSYFCLYKLYEDSKNWDKSFYYLKKVNEFLNKRYPFRIEKFKIIIKKLKNYLMILKISDYQLMKMITN